MGVVCQNTYYSLQGWVGGLEKAKKPLRNIKMAPNSRICITSNIAKVKMPKDYFNRLSCKLSFEPSKPKGISLYKINEAF